MLEAALIYAVHQLVQPRYGSDLMIGKMPMIQRWYAAVARTDCIAEASFFDRCRYGGFALLLSLTRVGMSVF